MTDNVFNAEGLMAFKRILEAVMPHLPDTDAPEGFMDDCDTVFKELGGNINDR